MDKIEINLNPRKESKLEVFLQKLFLFKPFIGLAAAGGLFAILVLSFFIIFKSGVYKNYKKEWKSWEDKYNLINSLKAEAAKLEKEKRDLEKALPPRIEMAKIMENIFSALPKNIWFHTLALNGQTLFLNGYLVKWNEDEYVSLDKKFIAALKSEDYFAAQFKKIKIKNTEKVNFYGAGILEFNIECTN